MTHLFSNPHFRILIITSLAMITTACGFHLRGNYLLPEDVSHVSVTSFDSYNTLTREVKKQLKLNGVEIVTPAADVANLYLISESDSNRTLSLYQNARAAEYELAYSVSYRVLVPGYDSRSFQINVTRSYLDNPLAALAKSVEKDMILDEMREQAAEQIIRQMARLKAQLVMPESNRDTLQDFPTNSDPDQVDMVDDNVEQTTSTTEVTENSPGDSNHTETATEENQ
ncbi:LPS-assembly lipoprotein LptE [Vibrio casei]|nr:LPS-assembly lipoprotein RlpB precursor (Rare lipoprotein B) [Vibrio casei]